MISMQDSMHALMAATKLGLSTLVSSSADAAAKVQHITSSAFSAVTARTSGRNGARDEGAVGSYAPSQVSSTGPWMHCWLALVISLTADRADLRDQVQQLRDSVIRTEDRLAEERERDPPQHSIS